MSTPNHNPQHQDTSNHIHININTTNSDPHNPFLDQEHENGELFGVILSRRFHKLEATGKQDFGHDDGLVRKTVSMRMEKQDSALDQTAVRRVFSMRKTNSDSPMLTSYGRIIDNEYDQVDDDEVVEDEENLLLTPRIQYYKKRNNLFQVCRRLFGF